MSETTRVVIPYESMDPLAIGATDDESKKHRDTLELDIPTRNLIAHVVPDEPAPVGNATEAAHDALANPVDGPAFAEILAGKSSVAVIIDNQFRPTPSSKLLPPVFDAIDAAGITDVRVVCANGKVFPMSESDMEQKLGRANLERMERNGWAFLQNDPRNADAYTFVGRLLGRHADLAAYRGRALGGQDHHRSGPGEPLGRRRRRQADSAGGRLRRDDRVQPLRVRHLAADALRRVCRADALGYRRGRVHVRARLHDERDPGHARSRGRLRLRLASRGPPRGDPPLQCDLHVRVVRARARPGGHRRFAASSRQPTICSSIRAGVACPPTSC